jgi:BTB/POZ domain-containing protein KCTD9
MRIAGLLGTIFKECNLKYVNMSHAFIHDANFEKSDLYGSDFIEVVGGITEPKESMYYSPGFNGVNFRKANLREVDFTKGDLRGADFRGAKFENTNFTETNLKEAIFSKEEVKKLNLTEEQLKVIITE